MSTELKNKSDISIVLVFFSVLAIIGVTSGGFVVQDYARARASATWPFLDGIVLSQLEVPHRAVRYVYSMNGHSYESSRERVLLASFLKQSMQEYLPGETVTVFVNPAKHSYSILYPGGAGGAFVLFSVLSGACIFFGIGGVVWALSQSAGQNFDLTVGQA